MNGKLEARSATDQFTSSRATKKRGKIAESTYIKKQKRCAPKESGGEKIFEKKRSFEKQNHTISGFNIKTEVQRYEKPPQ
jgi:hypothetical protein